MDESLEQGRAAYLRGEWHDAYEALSRAASTAPLQVEDLEALGESAWLIGKAKRSINAAEDVYTQLLRAGEDVRAGTKALEVSLLWANRGDLTLASGWLNRARRDLGAHDGPARGYLAYLEAMLALELGDPTPAQDLGVRLQHDAVRLDAPVLASLGLVLSGLAEISSGRTGFAQLDEAMLPILADRVPRLWAGDVYCVVIHYCHRLGDLARMRAWTDAMSRWCETLAAEKTYTGVCRVHRLELAAYDSAVTDGEAQLRSLCTELAEANVWVAGAGWYALGELRRRRGDLTGAAEAYEQARSLGSEPQPGEALAWCAAGRVEPAYLALRAAAESADPLSRVRFLPALVEVALMRDAIAEAERFSAELATAAATYGSVGYRAWARQARGAVSCANGDFAAAVPDLLEAIKIYREQHARYETGRVYEWLARAHRELGDPELADADLATALAIYRQVGAEADARRLDSGTFAGGLTGREAEILALIAAGATNREVAATACISEKTVSRHLANIFAKIGVSSRTAAAAWAREHGIV
ncbi:helix-turn-helix domain-containing protein [Aldersonia kunmingensis]|uniref:helix-turn-helix domain-containing protein n=1 Tax=Aldersonia kunmingensis TaxID=408066 RepID=UPI00082C1428|nr:helix-turn-helix transcriptional regulator [Aldersonia kunmingensis]